MRSLPCKKVGLVDASPCLVSSTAIEKTLISVLGSSSRYPTISVTSTCEYNPKTPNTVGRLSHSTERSIVHFWLVNGAPARLFVGIQPTVRPNVRLHGWLVDARV